MGIFGVAGWGEGLQVGNCETVQLGRTFDLVVFSEVIEHVNGQPRHWRIWCAI